LNKKINTVIIDIGKSHLKALLFNNIGIIKAEHVQKHNFSVKKKTVKILLVNKIYSQILLLLKKISKIYRIDKIIFTTHGATVIILLNNGNILPVLDYETIFDSQFEKEYTRNQKCSFSETLTPLLPRGLLLSKSIFYYLKKTVKNISLIESILFYPQYFAWKLSGVQSSEITYFGCHSDLWSFKRKDFSSFVIKNNLKNKFPQIYKSWSNLGKIKKNIVKKTNINPNCQIFCGVHDSNASYYLYEKSSKKNFTLISTGTWIVFFNKQMNLKKLDEKNEMLAKLNVFGKPVPVIRFMGGREFDILINKKFPQKKINRNFNLFLRKKIFILPSFAEGGPFRHLKGKIINKNEINSQEAFYNLASLYIALVADYCLNLLRSKNQIIIDGGFIKNKSFLYCLSVLRKKQDILINNNSNGTAMGAFLLCNKNVNLSVKIKKLPKYKNTTILEYRREWLSIVK